MELPSYTLKMFEYCNNSPQRSRVRPFWAVGPLIATVSSTIMVDTNVGLRVYDLDELLLYRTFPTRKLVGAKRIRGKPHFSLF
jgi:hypothetical protein